MSKKLITPVGVLFILCCLGVGTFFIIKGISGETHKKDIEMAADCARTFDVPVRTHSDNLSGYVDTGAYTEYENSRRSKREECANKYHVTHQEIIDKIGAEDYQPR